MSEDREAILLNLIEDLRKENVLLRERINLLIRRVFGSKSEKLDRAQLELLLGLTGDDDSKKAEPAGGDTPAADPAAPSQKPRRAVGKVTRLPEHLPVQEEVIIPLPVQAEPEKFRCIGEEVTEQLDINPARYFRRRLIRKKYVRIDQPQLAPIIAPLPATLGDRCLATPAMAANVVTAKYCDHLPLYRQEQILLNRYGINISRQTLLGWIDLVVFWMRPIYDLIKATVLDGQYFQIDETPIRYLEPGHGSTKQGYLWTVNRPGYGVFFHWEVSRAADCLERIVPKSFNGTLQSDAYSAYQCFAARHQEPLDLAGCWAHVRRKFIEAKEGEPRRCALVIMLIQQLYIIEKDLHKEHAGPALRQARRTAQSRMVVERLGKMFRMWQQGNRILPKSKFGQAIQYALGAWKTLMVFLDNGLVEIDNNLVENAIRPSAIGKKNWMFIGSEAAGENTAILLTLVEECRRLSIDPEAYLSLALSRLPAMSNQQLAFEEITPAATAKLLGASVRFPEQKRCA